MQISMRVTVNANLLYLPLDLKSELQVLQHEEELHGYLCSLQSLASLDDGHHGVIGE